MTCLRCSFVIFLVGRQARRREEVYWSAASGVDRKRKLKKTVRKRKLLSHRKNIKSWEKREQNLPLRGNIISIKKKGLMYVPHVGMTYSAQIPNMTPVPVGPHFLMHWIKPRSIQNRISVMAWFGLRLPVPNVIHIWVTFLKMVPNQQDYGIVWTPWRWIFHPKNKPYFLPID